MKNVYKVNEDTVKKIAERVYDNGSTVINRNDLEEMFPELKKESEDESIRKEIISAVNIYCSEYSRGTKVREDMLAWLEKQGEKPTWSEEDIRKIKLICTYLDAYKAYQTPVGAEYIDGCISWAKALISRVGCEADCTTTWKPSGEQMKWLHDTIESTQYEPRKQALISLYSDLMKLREE